MLKTAAVGMSALLVVLLPHVGLSEDLSAREVRYEFQRLSDPGYPNCTIALFIANPPAPEFVNVRLRVDAELKTGQMFFGLSTDVGEQLFVGGKPHGIKVVPIAQAELATSWFDTLGQLNPAKTDGGILLGTQDADVFSRLYFAFTSGKMTMRFTRDGTSMVRGYDIGEMPPLKVRSSFNDCMSNMLAALHR